ncbi:MAG: YdcF family protein, partial [Gammaproteobacteria bacterium]|nr:YdcF family protein [Gammaproteobacteria bacterium]
STAVVAEWLAAQLETVPALTPTQLQTSRADAIWVLMAGVERHNPELNGADRLAAMSLERIDFALALHRKTGLPIVVSGGSVRGDTEPLAELASAWLQDRAGVRPLAVDNTSRDTWENAHNSAAILTDQGVHRVLLVTHAFHMPRAVLSARAAGIDVVPAPFAFMHAPTELRPPLRAPDWLPTYANLEKSYLVLHEMAGLVWYGLIHSAG